MDFGIIGTDFVNKMLKRCCFVDKIFKLIYTIRVWVFILKILKNFSVELCMDKLSILLSFENVIKCVDKIKSVKISEFGIRAAHFNCMMHIDLSDEGLTPTELSKDCGVDKAFVSRTTADLIKGGFIQTNQKYNDGRKYRNKYILTEKGKEVIRETKALIEKHFSEISEKFSEYEMKCFLRVMMAISEAVNQKNAETK